MLTIHTHFDHLARKQYVFRVLFEELLGVDYRVVPGEAREHQLVLPNGNTLHVQDQFSLINDAAKASESSFWQAVLSVGPAQEPMPDIFAAAFCLLTNLDMYGNADRDRHDRFPAQASVPYRFGFLHRPVIHEWAEVLKEALLRKGRQGDWKKNAFRISLSCDVDHPLLWWNKSARLKTVLGAVMKRNDWNEAAFWVQNHLFKAQDPYDVFDEWFERFEAGQYQVQFNFMGERPVQSDCWYPLRHPFVRNLMEKIARRGHSIGFHPSYEAYENQDIFNRELASLQEISPLEIVAGRQHYLRFDPVRTWRMWAEAGLKEDSTLGFPEQEGFRNGMCRDFPVFDLEKGGITTLREKPLIAMDVTLAQYQNYTPEQGLEKLQALKQAVMKYGGDFTLLWHNSSWNTPFWTPWKRVFQQFIND